MSQTKRAYDKFLLYAMLIIALGVVGFISATTVIDPNYLNTTGGVVAVTGTFSGALTGTTLDTGQGANELYDMDQNVLQASAVTFSTVNTGQGANELYDMDQNVLQASAVTFSTVNTGQGANELFDMDQNVLQTSDVTFDNVTITDELTLGGVARTAWPAVHAPVEDLLIYELSGTAYAYNSVGVLVDSGANHSDVIINGLAGLPATSDHRRRTILFRGNFDIAAPVTLPEYITVNAYGASFELTYNGNMFVGTGASISEATEFVIWSGGWFDGNKAAQNAGSAFYGAWDDCKFYDLTISYFPEYAFHAITFDGTYRTIATQWVNCWFGITVWDSGSELGGLFLENTNFAGATDNEVESCYFINNENFNIYGEHCNWLRVHDSWFAGDTPEDTTVGIWLTGGSQTNEIYSNVFENHDRQAIMIDNEAASNFANRNHIHDNHFIDNCKSADNTYDTIYIVSHNPGAVTTGKITNNLFSSTPLAAKPRYHIHLDDVTTTGWDVFENQGMASSHVSTAVVKFDSLDNNVGYNGGELNAYISSASAPTGAGCYGTSLTYYNSTSTITYVYTYTSGGWQRVAVG